MRDAASRHVISVEGYDPEIRGLGREGMVTVWDDEGRYIGCMGVETWRRLLEEEATVREEDHR